MIVKHQNTLSSRIAKLLASAIFASVLFAASLHIVFQVFRDIEQQKSSLQATAYALAAAAGDAVANNDKVAAQTALTAISRMPDVDMAAITKKDGSTFAVMGQTVFLTTEIMRQNDSSWALLFKGKLPVSVEIVKAGVVRGNLTIVGDIGALSRNLAWSILTILAAAVFTAFLGVMAARPLQQRIVGPLSQLTKTIQAMQDSRNYSGGLIDDETPDETGVLVKAFNGLMSDVRSRDEALKQLAYHDALTGLPNRVQFQEHLSDYLKKPTDRLFGAVLLFNIHGFRAINDAFSHAIGDKVLMRVAEGLKTASPDAVMIARYSSNEFAIFLADVTTENELQNCVGKLHQQFSKPISIAQLELHITLTVGAATLFNCSADAATADIILQHADTALAEAKRDTPGTLRIFQNSMQEKILYDTELKQSLRQACAHAEFSLNYQSQFNLQENRVAGFEALVRWKHAELGFISPAVFIPMAEEMGLIGVVGEWVLNESCRQAAAWHRQGETERVMSVNVSPAQILAADFIDKVRLALKQSGLPPQFLCLELTESIFVGGQFAETVVILETLENDGVKLALDDFGTGYSSLSYISKLPFHSIKIDRAFVADAHKSQRKSSLLKSIVNLIHTLGLETVAEGAESLEEVQLLAEFGVKKVQGYVYAKPLPAAEAIARAAQLEASYCKISA
jgi:diguanylate cyclase (GGDEF)-like protein